MYPAYHSSPPLRLGPGNWPTPTLHPLVLLLLVVLAVGVTAGALWSLVVTAVLADPRPEVRGFVDAVRAGAVTPGDRAALVSYRATLSAPQQEALAHEINYLLLRAGRPERFAFAGGRLIDMPAPPTLSPGTPGVPAAPPALGRPEPAGRSGPPAVVADPGPAVKEIPALKDIPAGKGPGTRTPSTKGG